MSAPFLSLRGLGVSYRDASGRTVTALEDVTLDLATGRRLAVIGESGSGKSTLALAVAGLLSPSAKTTGEIVFPALGRPRLGRDLGVVFQDPSGSLDPVISVGDQIAEIIVTHLGMRWSEALTRAADLLDQVRIPRSRERLRSFPHEFSGGQRQRIAIAAALAVGPKLLIADEPTSALDTVVQRELVTLFDELTRERGLTLLFVTHDIALASELADDIAVLYRGRRVEAGAASEVLRQPAHRYTQALLSTRLDLDTPIGTRLPEVDAADFSVRTPQPAR